MLVKEDSVNTRYQQEKRTSALPVIPYWAVLGAEKKWKRINQNLICVFQDLNNNQKAVGCTGENTGPEVRQNLLHIWFCYMRRCGLLD